MADAVDPLTDEPWHVRASTDVGNVSWAVLTGVIDVGCTGMSIGEKGMLVAARTRAGATLELLANPKLAEAARRDFDARRAAKPNPPAVLAPDQTAPVTIR